MQIVAIGGGDARAGETLSIDEELVKLAGKARPRLLFIPTASEDAAGYVEAMTAAYGKLGCSVDSLRLLANPRFETIKRKIDSADLIYVGGGNTKKMLEIWRQTGVADLLTTTVREGKPVGGVSAGAICWFRVGNSDWPKFEKIEGVNTARLDCLGLVDLVLCPHTLNEEFRLAEFRDMMRKERGVGLGLDDCCAIQIRDDSFRILASQAGSVAHKIRWEGDQLIEEILEPHSDYKLLNGLIA